MANPIRLKILKKHYSLLKTNNLKKAPSLRTELFSIIFFMQIMPLTLRLQNKPQIQSAIILKESI